MEKWLKTLVQAGNQTLDNRYLKGIDRDIYDEELEDLPWSFRRELHGGSILDKDTDLQLCDEAGLAAAKESGALSPCCYKMVLKLDTPSLRVDTAPVILELVPSTFVVNEVERYVLGYSAFSYNKVTGVSSFICLLTDHEVEQGESVKLPFIPGTHRRLTLHDKFLQMSVVETPEWLYDGERKRERRTDSDVSEGCARSPEDGGESEDPRYDVPRFENAVQPPRGRRKV